ncbi:unnamed protein product [Plutella xylostella]|uniref:(diamondback moth) hypothetical protein n=1 Tax=Plutella xylostella TaxID=51655 RepID=A0A8S4FFI3_PLUXY|nr:unnamed protein product [Plutella xylostella]
MRSFTLSFLRNCKYKSFLHRPPQRLFSDTVQQQLQLNTHAGPLVELLGEWPAREEELGRAVLRDMRVLPDFISEPEEAQLMAELEPYLKKMRYEFDHWDDAIHGFRETERSAWSPANKAVLQRVLEAAFPPPAEPLPHQHVLDLAPTGHIKPHVDAVRFCGATIAGLSLLSPAVMTLRHSARPLDVAALLPRRSLYIMTGVARYEFTHAVEGGAARAWRGAAVRRARRVAVITRSQPRPEDRQGGDEGGTGASGEGAGETKDRLDRITIYTVISCRICVRFDSWAELS